MAERAPKATPWIAASGRELKLAIVAALAGLYLAIWPQLGVGSAGAPAPEPEPVTDLQLVSTSPRLAGAQLTWIDQLPARERPPVVVPAGWVLADRSATPASAATASPEASTTRARHAPVRVAATRARRIRTRSS